MKLKVYHSNGSLQMNGPTEQKVLNVILAAESGNPAQSPIRMQLTLLNPTKDDRSRFEEGNIIDCGDINVDAVTAAAKEDSPPTGPGSATH